MIIEKTSEKTDFYGELSLFYGELNARGLHPYVAVRRFVKKKLDD